MSTSVMSSVIVDARSSMMSATTPAITIAAPPPAKKRRRRTPTSGAADDCFTCRKEGSKCDRKRPYCQQCIDRGQTCSGYKTQLTWGVGVASRGKLRGLALPIAGSAALPTKVPDRRVRRKAASVDETAHSEKQHLSRPSTDKLIRAASFAGTTFVPEFSFDDLSSPMSAPLMSVPEMDWPSFEGIEAFPTLQVPQQQTQPRSLLTENLMQLPAANTLWDELTVPNSAGSTFSSWDDSDYASTVDFPATPEDMSFLTGSSLPMQHNMMCNHNASLCPSPISPAFSHSMLSPTFFPNSAQHTNFMLETTGPTSFPAQRMSHARTSSTMSCPSYWEPATSMFKPAGSAHTLHDTFCDDNALSSLGVYPSEWNTIPLMM